jgi:NADP-dependent 3-hydroxy acid dehydrogenase YdfG
MASVIQPQKTALITGAASGVGFAVAKLCRNKGMHLVLLDIDNENLIKAKTSLSDLNPVLKTEAFAMDVADRLAWKDIAGKISASFPEIDLVILNAGKGYKPQVQDGAGRLNPWLDTEYWSKVR